MSINTTGKRPAKSPLSGGSETKRQKTEITTEDWLSLFQDGETQSSFFQTKETNFLSQKLAPFIRPNELSNFAMTCKQENNNVKNACHSFVTKLSIEKNQNIQEVLKCYKKSDTPNTTLTELKIEGHNVTDDDLIYIANNFPSLKFLEFYTCRQITDAGVAHLAAQADYPTTA